MILILVPVALGLIFNPLGSPLATSAGFGVLNAFLVAKMLPVAGPALIKAGLSGRDRLKRDSPVLPETLGVVVGVIYLFSLLFFIPFMFFKYLVTTHGGGTRDDAVRLVNGASSLFPHSKLAEYLSGVLSLQSMLMLGVADDLFDLRWRHKFFLPAVAALPMLVIYYVDFGVTHVAIPPFLNWGSSVDLGWLYYAYMGAVAIFCTNCINIYAGVNGLEVGQAVVVALGALANDLLYICLLPSDNAAVASHRLSAFILVPFVGASLPLLKYNWWPAQGFVGDTFCYLAGMVFAVVGILGHFSKTMLTLFGPQIFNFIYSMPQLLRVVPCPRHRMPNLNKDNLLEPSTADISKSPAIVKKILLVLDKLRLVKVYDDKDGLRVSNLTLINLVLVWGGPMREDQLTTILLGTQAAWAVLAITARHGLAKIVYDSDNL